MIGAKGTRGFLSLGLDRFTYAQIPAPGTRSRHIEQVSWCLPRFARQKDRLVADCVQRRSDRQLIGGLRHPHDFGCDAKQPIVVVVHAIEIEPHNRLCEGLNGREGQKLRALEGLHAHAAGKFPIVRPLIIAADIGNRVRVDPSQRIADVGSRVLEAAEQASGLIGIERIVKFENVVEGGCTQRAIGNRLCDGRLQRHRRKGPAVLLVKIRLEADVPACDLKGRKAGASEVRRAAGDAGIERDVFGDIDRQRY